MRYFTSGGWLVWKKETRVSVLEEKLESLLVAGGNVSCCSYGKQYGSSSKIKHRIIIWSSNFTFGCRHKRIEGRDSNTCTPVFIAALFIIAKRSRQPKCFSEEECINKMWYMGISFSLKKKWRDSPGGPVAKTLCSQGRGPGVLSLLVGELDPCAKAKSLHAATKKKNKNPVCCVLCAVKTRCSQKKKKEIKFQHRLRYGWTLIK